MEASTRAFTLEGGPNVLPANAAVQETAVHDSLTSHSSAYRCASAGISLTGTPFCVRTVSDAPATPRKHRDLRGHSDAHPCCGKSLMGGVLMVLGMRQHARPESISKRARSTTPTSLRFGIKKLRTVWNSVAQNPPSNRPLPPSLTESASCERGRGPVVGNCVRPFMSFDHLRRSC